MQNSDSQPMTLMLQDYNSKCLQTKEPVDEPSSDSPLLDSIVSAANALNKVFQSSSCARVMCQVYTDKQIEYEITQDTLISLDGPDQLPLAWTASDDSAVSDQSASPVERAFMKYAPTATAFEVELYRKFLFDEESVVDAVMDRSEAE